MSRPDERADDEPSLGRLVMLAARRVREARVAAFEPYGLAAHQARAFLVVLRWSAGELRLSRLAERLHLVIDGLGAQTTFYPGLVDAAAMRTALARVVDDVISELA